MSKRTGPMDPPSYIGERLMTYEDIEALSERPTDELCNKLGGKAVPLKGPFTPGQKISLCQILYARLLAGIIPPEDRYEANRVLTWAIDEGIWLTWKWDVETIRLAIRGCGFMPGHPLALKEHPRTEADNAA